MKKALIIGPIFGLVFGLIEMLNVATGIGFDLISGILSLAAYIGFLIWIMMSEAKAGKGYGRRFLAGFVYSILIGLVYGIVAGIAGYIFAEQIVEATQEGLAAFEELGFEGEFASLLQETASEAEATPVQNLFGEIFGGIFFNLIFGSMFSAIFAAFFPASKVEGGKEVEVKVEEKEEEK
jgi:hypothetical protein